MSTTSIFEDVFNGKLYYLEEDETYLARIRYDYEKQVLRDILDGHFVFIENFNSDEDQKTYAMLKISSIFPKHYALEALKGGGYGYPGFLKDIMTNVEEDWELEESAETYIECVAIPMAYELITNANNSSIINVQKSIAKPIPGKDIKTLTAENLQIVFDWGLNVNESLTVGSYLVNDQIDVHVNLSRMVRRHFGVFASTGSGKSNFIAQLIRMTANEYFERTENRIKIVIFDIQGEYFALTSDILYERGLYIIHEAESFPNLDQYFEAPDDADLINNCADILSNQIKKPGIFERNNTPFMEVFRQLLTDERIIRLTSTAITVPQNVEQLVDNINPGNQGGTWQIRVFRLFQRKIVERGLTGFLSHDILNEFNEILGEIREEDAFQTSSGNLNSNARTVLFDYDNLLETIRVMGEAGAGESYSADDLINDIILNEENYDTTPNIIIIAVSDQDLVINIATRIVNACLFSRRANPTFNHEVLFMFDEAHEYISTSTQEQTPSVRTARRSLLRLARQGRKYGLGMCISTQRTRYLDTTIMGQIHTLFAGYLPRKTDREPLVDAFDIGTGVINEVKNFAPGQWLLASASATGLLRSVPISFRAINTETELENFFRLQNWI